MDSIKELAPEESDGFLVGKAVTRAADELGLRQNELAEIVGLSAPKISRVKDGTAPINGKANELALYLIRIFRSLHAITGGDAVSLRAWMRKENTALGAVPAEAVKQAAGLVDTMNYLDAARAPI